MTRKVQPVHAQNQINAGEYEILCSAVLRAKSRHEGPGGITGFRRKKVWLPGICSLGLFCFLLCSAIASAASSKLSPELQNASGSATTNVIVQFAAPPSQKTLSSVTSNGGSMKQTLNSKAVLYNLPGAAIQALTNNSNVRYASPDRAIAGKLEFAEPTVNANIALQYGWDGTGVGVAIIDSGIYATHPDLQNGKTSRVVYSQSFVPNDTTTNDAYGHGTHVGGIVGGNGAMSSGGNAIYTFRGIAPNVNLVNLRVLDANGQGTDSSVISAIQQAINLKSQYNIRVINLSLGRQVVESYTLDPLCQAVEAAWNAGIVVVVSAGNDGRDNSMGTNGYDTITSPGNDPYALTVGSMKDMSTVVRGDDLIASYSSKGPTLLDQVVKPDLVAPGNRIISALAPNSTLYNTYPANIVPLSFYMSNNSGSASNFYFTLSGTSMAAPMVSGAAALLLQQNASLTPDQVKARLMKTASKAFPASSVATDPATGIAYTDYYDIFTIGAGYLDVWAALNNTDVASGSAMSPKAVYSGTSGTASVVMGTNVVWGTGTTWATNVVWGTTTMSGNTLLASTNIVWGTTTLSGFNVVWGTNITWGTSTPFSEALSIAGEN